MNIKNKITSPWGKKAQIANCTKGDESGRKHQLEYWTWQSFSPNIAELQLPEPHEPAVRLQPELHFHRLFGPQAQGMAAMQSMPLHTANNPNQRGTQHREKWLQEPKPSNFGSRLSYNYFWNVAEIKPTTTNFNFYEAHKSEIARDS